jgi:hypothetical protein
MASRNAYLSKFLLVKSLDAFPFEFGVMKTLYFTPQKGTRHYGSVNKQSHVIVDYRPIFEKYDDLIYAIINYTLQKDTFRLLHDILKLCKFIKIKSLTMQQIREIHDANMYCLHNWLQILLKENLLTKLTKFNNSLFVKFSKNV